MTAEFISAVVDLARYKRNQTRELRFTPAPTTYTMESQWLHVVCQDDAFFTQRSKSSVQGSWVSKEHTLAMLEAKALYKSWSEDEDVVL
jgi:hypothetical protein